MLWLIRLHLLEISNQCHGRQWPREEYVVVLLGGYALTKLQMAPLELANSISSHLGDQNGLVPEKDVSKEVPSNNNSMRRKKSQKNNKAATVITIKSGAVEKKRSVVMQWFYSLKAAFYNLYKTFKQPVIVRYSIRPINNLGTTVGSFVGAGSASLLNVLSGSFGNLFMGIRHSSALAYPSCSCFDTQGSLRFSSPTTLVQEAFVVYRRHL
ncbi:hypothetical protein C5167_003477 [Papaver somniferum]|uniref:Uncharacterized protein n=1 Tax=Papaver somniferum TaxID=3469 RepID=A0A4Y7L4D7_PAPSO|nr:hypothetical protein C5167_003477 [Papaver somniferum]